MGTVLCATAAADTSKTTVAARIFSVIGTLPEPGGYAVAKFSRSARPYEEWISELTQEGASRFYEQFYFDYGPDANYGSKTPLAYGGLQITPRTSFANLAGLTPDTEYHYRLVGTNEKGTVVEVWPIEASGRLA